VKPRGQNPRGWVWYREQGEIKHLCDNCAIIAKPSSANPLGKDLGARYER